MPYLEACSVVAEYSSPASFLAVCRPFGLVLEGFCLLRTKGQGEEARGLAEHPARTCQPVGAGGAARRASGPLIGPKGRIVWGLEAPVTLG